MPFSPASGCAESTWVFREQTVERSLHIIVAS